MAKKRPQLKLLVTKDDPKNTFDKNSIGRRSSSDKGSAWNFQSFLQRHFSSGKSVKLLTLSISAFLIFTALIALIQLPNLNTNYSVEQFFPDNHPLITESQKIRQTFFLEDRPGFLVLLNQPENSNSHWLEPKQLELLKQISEHFQSHSEILKVTSLAEIQGVFESADTLTVGPIFENLDASKWKRYVQSQPLIQSQIISEDLKSTLMVLEPDSLSPERLSVLSTEIAEEVRNLTPGIEVQVGGVPAIQGRFASRLYDELKLYLVLSLICFCLVFSFLIKGKSALIFTLINLVVGNILILGGLAFLGVPFSVLLTTLPVINSIVVVSLCVHCLHRWAERIQELEEEHGCGFRELPQPLRFQASSDVLRELALPNFLGSLTTSIGFLMLVTSVVPLIREYAWTISISVMITWAVVQLLLLAYMYRCRPQLRKWTQRKSTWTLWFLKWAKPAAAFTLVLFFTSLWFGREISFSGRLFDDLPRSEPARIITETIDRDFGGVVGYDLVLRSTDEGYFRKLNSAESVQALTQEIRKQPVVGSAISFVDLLGEKFPRSDAALAETLFLYSMSSNNPMNYYVTDSGGRARISVRFHDLPSEEVAASRKEILAQARKAFPELEVLESGLSVRTHTINTEVSKALIFGFWESLALIGLLIVGIFRSLRWSLVACLPNLLPPAVLLGAMAFAETPIKPGVALIFSIALGLAFNNTVYLLSRLKKIKDEKRLHHLPLRQALLQEGNPCLFETLVMFFGFMIFLTSDFQVNQTFGIYMLLSIFTGFIGDLVFLPAALKLFPRLLTSQRTQTAKAKSESEPASASIAASIALAIFLIFQSTSVEAKTTPEAEAVLKKVRAKVEAKDDQAKITMVIKEPNGQKKERVLELHTLRDEKFYALARILSPADVKGTSLLAEITEEDETHWLYVPSTKKVRRVVGANKESGVLGSELMMEDLNSTAIKSASVKVRSKDAKTIVLEIIPKKGTSLYSRVLSTISAKEFVPLKTYYYKGKKLAKTVAFGKYTKVAGNIWRAQAIYVKNLLNKRGTDLFLEDIKVNTGLDRDEFSVSALKLD